MPTLAPPQQFFGYGRKPYADYFPPAARPSYGVPTNPDPYGQAGNEELQLAAQKKVLETLGTLDQIEAAKQEREQRLKYLPQTRDLQDRQMQDKLGQGFAQIGGYNRAQQAERDATSIDWSTPAGRAAASELAKRSPEHADAVAKAFSLQSRIEGPSTFGRDQEQKNTEATDYLASLHPRYQEQAKKMLTDGLHVPAIKGQISALQQEDETAQRLIAAGVPKEKHGALKTGGYFDPVLAEEARVKALQEGPKTKEAIAAIQRQGISRISQLELKKAQAEQNGDDPSVLDTYDREIEMIRDIHHLNDFAPLQTKPKPVSVGEPTIEEKQAAFKAKFGMEPKDKAHWSMAYDLAKQNKLAQGASAPAGEVQQMYVPPTTSPMKKRVFPTEHPPVRNGDGSGSNVMLGGFNIDGREYVIPTMVGGKQLTEEEAVTIAKKQGLDKYPSFATPQEATAWAQANHDKIDPNGYLIDSSHPTSAAPPQIPASHISALIAHPEAAKDFDAKYGAGAAAKVLGKK